MSIKSIILGFCILSVMCPTPSAWSQKKDAKRENIWQGEIHNFVGNCDFSGGGTYWFYPRIDPGLDLGNIPLDLKLKFSTKSLSGARHLGPDCSVPLLDSNVVQYAENIVQAWLPDGSMNWMYSKDGVNYESQDTEWKGTLSETEKDAFELKHEASGSVLRFKRGVIVGMSLGDRKFIWSRSKQKVSIDDANAPLLTGYMNAEGFIEQIRIHSGRDKGLHLRFEFDKQPNFSKEGIILSMSPAISKIFDSAGNSWKVERSYETGNGTKQTGLVADYANGFQETMFDFISGLSTGQLVSDSESSYEILERSTNGTDSVANVLRTFKDGKIEQYKLSLTTGIASHTRPDGSKQERFYILAPGATFAKARKIIDTKADGSTVETQSSFDSAGEIIKNKVKIKQ